MLIRAPIYCLYYYYFFEITVLGNRTNYVLICGEIMLLEFVRIRIKGVCENPIIIIYHQMLFVRLFLTGLERKWFNQ